MHWTDALADGTPSPFSLSFVATIVPHVIVAYEEKTSPRLGEVFRQVVTQNTRSPALSHPPNPASRDLRDMGYIFSR